MSWRNKFKTRPNIKALVSDWSSRISRFDVRTYFSNARHFVVRVAMEAYGKVRRTDVVADVPTLETRTSVPVIPPSTRVYAIGDIHGRADLLDALLAQIDHDQRPYDGQVVLVFLGDYIDRGLQSCQVIDRLVELSKQHPQTVLLRGNHEEAMMNFLADYSYGPKWANYGGRETLVSYGVRPPRSMALGDDWIRAHDDLKRALPVEHERFLQTLLTHAEIGGFGFVHAGVRPGVPFSEQSDRDRLWIRDEFLSAKSCEELVIVHGHTPTDVPYKDKRRIGVDTGAYFTGCLTAVRLEGDSVDFISTSL